MRWDKEAVDPIRPAFLNSVLNRYEFSLQASELLMAVTRLFCRVLTAVDVLCYGHRLTSGLHCRRLKFR